MQPLESAAIAGVLDDLCRPGNFFQAAPLHLRWSPHVAETIPWEVDQGRLVAPRRARRQGTFLSWNLHQLDDGQPAPEPILALKWDQAAGTIYVTRALLTYVWEAHDAGGNVIESRETIRWLPELIGTLDLDDFTDVNELSDELRSQLGAAVVGVSRLPLTSIEAPLPAFVLGQLAFAYQAERTGSVREGEAPAEPPSRGKRGSAGASPSPRTANVTQYQAEANDSFLTSWPELLERAFRDDSSPKLLEAVLRSAPADDIRAVATRFAELRPAADAPRLLRALFNDVSLSPYTQFVDNALAFLRALVDLQRLAPVEEIDFLGYLLRQLGRHLTAYDLVAFHHQGANYPDALLLDAALSRLLDLLERQDAFFAGHDAPARLRRRALRQGCLLRRVYEGHAVPDAPTSPGENARVLPAPFQRVPDEQLLQTRERRRRLFTDRKLADLLGSTARRVLTQAIDDLEDGAELAELGTAVFIDRPLGFGKDRAEPDQTLLLAHETFSAGIARRRLGELEWLASDLGLGKPGADLRRRLQEETLRDGIALEPIADLGRPVAALTDALRVSDDFVVVRTMPSSLRAFFATYDWSSLWERFGMLSMQAPGPRWLVRVRLDKGQSVMTMLDAEGQTRVLFEADPARGYRVKSGVEVSRAGLRIWHLRDDAGQVHDLTREDVRSQSAPR